MGETFTLPLKLAQKLYAHDEGIDPERVRLLCPKCRQLDDARRNERLTAQQEETQAETAAQAQAAN